MVLIDTHCHLDYIARNTAIEPVIKDAKDHGINTIINPSVCIDQLPDVLAMAERYDHVYAAVAIHPTDVAEDTAKHPNWQDHITQALAHPKAIAVGETGLDYHWDKTHHDTQKACFRWFLELARERELPVIVHDREAHDDVAACIDAVPGVRGVMHCFSGDADFATVMIDKGFYISFAGNVTFKNAKDLHAAAVAVPLDKLLIETDAPFLSPHPHRGEPNAPARVALVAQKIAELKGVPVEEVAEITTANARAIFGLE